MEDKIKLLMEETGCDEGEAQLALEISNDDFEQSIYTIKTILRNIVVVKSKFYIEESNLYGIFIFFLNKRSDSLMKLLGVISYNPVVYETSLNNDWYMVQKAIYNYRLLEGSIPAFTQQIELHFCKQITADKDKFFKSMSEDDSNKIQEILMADFPSGKPVFHTNIEEINLAQFQLSSDTDKSREVLQKKNNPKPLNMESTLLEHASGVKAKALNSKDIVLAKIIDKREIARYISKLLGTKDAEYIPVPVDDIQKVNNEITVKLTFAQGVVGYAKLPSNKRIRVLGRPEIPFWRRIFRF